MPDRFYSNVQFTTLDKEFLPLPPVNRRLCPGCFDAMQLAYAWKSSEHVVHYFFVCHCGTRTKGRLQHYRINSRGGLEL